ncbi:hypothetical protein N780_20030 [Pontibacillus chungwhensis BH030062]|uniref:DUF3899 domain-containing protein n=1 Tax=Pontibacillus chungwhensis BH030062 TaxID=1385513 RepID=A0A0A2UXN9_9BACI|nr:DUF3899 domain-containing protein [Pontibacillus chungwhensis]KGP91523.1 hypothetical protein N780_20030 [Pontibacillus chungwhensis BH030062]
MFFVIPMALSAIILVLCYGLGNFELVHMVNTAFYWGLISLTVGTFLHIIQTGFFRLFTSGFKQLKRRTRSAERVEQMLKEDGELQSWKRGVLNKSRVMLLGIGLGLTLSAFGGVMML